MAEAGDLMGSEALRSPVGTAASNGRRTANNLPI